MKSLLSKLKSKLFGHREAGMATAEYAVGTVVVISIATIIYRIIASEPFRDAVWNLILWLFRLITGISGE
ncbi:MAG: DUF4244 domain-containing protein [Propionibacteriaceae bacterium]|nr:DUF4244 domain-containing protein [Propionibacteriaceae bacterium]